MGLSGIIFGLFDICMTSRRQNQDALAINLQVYLRFNCGTPIATTSFAMIALHGTKILTVIFEYRESRDFEGLIVLTLVAPLITQSVL